MIRKGAITGGVTLGKLDSIAVNWPEWQGRMIPKEVALVVKDKLRDVQLVADERRFFLGVAALLEDWLDEHSELDEAAS